MAVDRGGHIQRSDIRISRLFGPAAAFLMMSGMLAGGDVAEAATTSPAGVHVTVTLPMLADPGALNPLYARDVYAREVSILTEPTLLRAGSGGRWLPYLAEAASASDGGRVLSFRLNPHARWSDGARITAADVIATFEAAAAPSDRTAYAGLFASLASIVATKPDTVQVAFHTPVADGLLRVGLVPVLPASVVRPRMGRPASLAAWNPVTVRGALAGGPYRAVSGNLATGHLTFALRPGFWIRASLPPRLALQYEFTTDEAWSAFLAGRLSAVSVPRGDAQTAARLKRAHKAVVVELPDASDTLMAFNLRDPVLESTAVREAIRLTVPSAKVARMLGEVPTPDGPSPWSPTGTLGSGAPPGPDLASARRTLDAAGWVVSSGNPYRVRNGQTLSFTCVTVTGVPAWDAAMSAAAEALARVGIDMNITYLPFRTLSQMLASPQTLPTSIGAYALAYASAPGSGAASLYGGAATDPPAGADAGRYANPVVTRLLLDGEGQLTPAQRRRLTRRLVQALASDPPAIFFGTARTTLAVAPRDSRYFVGPRAGLVAWWNEEGDP